MTTKEKKRVVSYILLIVVVSVTLSVWGSRIDTSGIVLFVQRMGIWAPLIYIIIGAIPSIVAPLSSSPIFISGYILFDNRVQFYAYLSMLLASVINFWIARKWGRLWVRKLVGKDDLAKVDAFANDYGLLSLIFLRVFQGHISDFVSYAYGLTRMKFVPYLIICILAPIPWLLLWQYYIFPRVDNVADFSFWFLITLIPVLIISWFYWKYKNKRNK